MKILFIVPYVPTLVRVRPYNLIRYLSKFGHHVSVLTLSSASSNQSAVEELKGCCSEVSAVHLSKLRSVGNSLAKIFGSEPLQASYCWHPELARRANKQIIMERGKPSFDVVHVEHLRGFRYALHLKDLNIDIPIVWDSVDSISLLFRQTAVHSSRLLNRLIAKVELPRTERYEAFAMAQVDRTIVTSSKDKYAFTNLAKNNSSVSIDVLPNGVDLEYFRSDPEVQVEPDTLVVSGKMSYHANISMVIHLVTKIMPHIWKHKPNAKLRIVGKDPPLIVQELAIKNNIQVTGTVKDIRPFLQGATVALSPLTYGAGIQNKVLEAMACGTPVVASSKAISAIDVLQDRDILVSDDPNEFAKLVVRLLEDRDYRNNIGDSGRKYVEQFHNWERIVQRLVQIYQDVCSDHGSIPECRTLAK